MQFDLPKLKYNGGEALSPKQDDLDLIYKLIKYKKPENVLEFGCGYSTIVIEKALIENGNGYKFCAVDTNVSWIEEVMPHVKNVKFLHSNARTYVYESSPKHQVPYHLYDYMPDIYPDFIYLDGPAPMQVIGWTLPGMPISLDLCRYEDRMKVGATVLIDGRVTNTLWLNRFVKRPWAMQYDFDSDITIMQLLESNDDKKKVKYELMSWISENA